MQRKDFAMRALLSLLTIILLVVQIVSAQETTEPTDWTTEQRCITAPSQPPEGWTYDGVIFTFIPGDGVHARRADVATPYYVAFDSDSEFGAAGSLSPDGKWVAVPLGHTESVNLNSDYYITDRIRLYSTSPLRTVHDFPVRDSGFSPPQLRWLSAEHVVIDGFDVIDPFEQAVIPFEVDRGLIIQDASLDGSRLILGTHSLVARNLGREPEYYLHFTDDLAASAVVLPIMRPRLEMYGNRPFMPLTRWTADSSRFIARLAGQDQVGLFDRNGRLLDAIPVQLTLANFAIESHGTQVSFSDFDGTMKIADFETRTIIDTCIDRSYSAAFSPDGRQLAFGLRSAGYVYILDIEAWEAYRIDLAAADVIGWYPVE